MTVGDDGQTYTLSNGILTARISRTSGNLTSLIYNGIETLDPGGRNSGYWSHSAAADQGFEKITIDPKTNGGERGEVAIKGVSNGNPMGAGPGGSMVADIEIRWCAWPRRLRHLHLLHLRRTNPSIPAHPSARRDSAPSSTTTSSIG